MSTLIQNTIAANAISIPGNFVILFASGTVDSSGWSNVRLSPSYLSGPPPKNGIWDISFLGSPPTGPVLNMPLPVAAEVILAAPSWLVGFNIISASGTLPVTLARLTGNIRNANPTLPARKKGDVIYRQTIATYDDSFGQEGFCAGFSLKMHKLQHELDLVIEGPDQNQIQSCVQQSLAAGLVAAIIAVYATGGGALSAAISAFIAALEGCLGNAYSVNIENNATWVYWCT